MDLSGISKVCETDLDGIIGFNFLERYRVIIDYRAQRRLLAELERRDAPTEMQFSLPDQWSRQLFLALCRRYGLKPYRLYRQRLTTVMLRVPKGFVDQVLWPEFQELNEALTQYLSEVTIRVIREEVHRDTSEAAEVPHALPAK